ncbi:MAG: Maf family protein [Thermoplasmatota archaeon]
MMLVLASGSPRRAAILRSAGMEFVVRCPGSSELHGGKPEETVVSNAVRKARSVPAVEGETVLGADTMVACLGHVLGKPEARHDAARMLALQVKAPQEVYTGLCLRVGGSGRELTGYEVSRVVMEGDESSIEKYLDTGLWEGKAGGYGIQDDSQLGVRLASGEMDNVIGLPMKLLFRLLDLAAYEYPARTPR